jgi:hypothetical protein
MRTGALETQLSMDAALENAEDWATDAHRWIAELLFPGVHLTAESLRRAVGDPPNPNAMGAVFRSAARAGLITCTGWQTSKRPERHGAVIREWRRL